MSRRSHSSARVAVGGRLVWRRRSGSLGSTWDERLATTQPIASLKKCWAIATATEVWCRQAGTRGSRGPVGCAGFARTATESPPVRVGLRPAGHRRPSLLELAGSDGLVESAAAATKRKPTRGECLAGPTALASCLAMTSAPRGEALGADRDRGRRTEDHVPDLSFVACRRTNGARRQGRCGRRRRASPLGATRVERCEQSHSDRSSGRMSAPATTRGDACSVY
jgi:hypothetical protein